MSTKNVKAFFEQVEEDQKLQKKLISLDKKAKSKLKALRKKAQKVMDSALDDLVRTAKAAGYSFTPKDIIKVRSKQFTRVKDGAIVLGDESGKCASSWTIGDPPCPPPCAHGHYNPNPQPSPHPEPHCASWYPVV